LKTAEEVDLNDTRRSKNIYFFIDFLIEFPKQCQNRKITLHFLHVRSDREYLFIYKSTIYYSAQVFMRHISSKYTQ